METKLYDMKRMRLRNKLAAAPHEELAQKVTESIGELMDAATITYIPLSRLVDLRLRINLIIRNMQERGGADPAEVQALEDTLLLREADEEV